MADKAQANKHDLISRGDHTPTPIGRAVFVVVRALDPLLQYGILAQGLGTPLLHGLGLRTLPAGLPAQTGIHAVDRLGLSPYRLVLFAMAVGSTVKQNIWVTTLSAEPMPVGSALTISAYNSLLNSLNHFLFLASATSASAGSLFPQPALLVGSALYAAGIVTELAAEVQRRRFKADPANGGKPCTGGLWSLARHVNYGAYAVWRTGYAAAAGGWVWGAVTGAWLFTDFATRAVPILDAYCEERYGADWQRFKQQTKYRLIPGLY